MRVFSNQKSIVMSRPINITDFIQHITPSHNRVSKFILSSLELEVKLSYPEEQSEYFRWGLKNHKKYHRWTIDDYHELREEFNGLTVDRLIAAKEEAENILLEKIPSVHPLFARAFMRGATMNLISKYEDYLQMKPITNELPSWEELKDDSELLESILSQ